MAFDNSQNAIVTLIVYGTTQRRIKQYFVISKSDMLKGHSNGIHKKLIFVCRKHAPEEKATNLNFNSAE